MSKQTEALKLALEALKQIDEAMPFPVAKLAQQVIREALAEQPAQQEPVAWMYHDRETGWVIVQKEMRGFVDHTNTTETPLYTAPPRREWVGLTDEEWQEIDASLNGKRDLARIFTRALEAKLKEKNT